MAATVSMLIDKGSGPTGVVIGGALGTPGLRFRTDDNPDTLDNTNPIPVPSAGSKYSFWLHLFLKVTGGSFTNISNIKFYTAGGNLYGDSGVSLQVGTETPTKNSGSTAGYAVATGTVGESGNEVVVGHPGITGKTDASTFIAASMKSVSISEAGSVIDAVGETSNYVVLQLQVTNTATAGTKTPAVLTIRYDET